MDSTKGILISGLILIGILLGVWLFVPKPGENEINRENATQTLKPQTSAQQTNSMQLLSSAFSDNAYIPSQFSCEGDNINPPLQLINPPSKAQSLVLILEDPDAPSGTFQHWLLYNLSPQTTEILQNSVPENTTQGKNSVGKTGYMGPCPPTGTHRYIFRLYALDIEPTLPPDLDRAGLDQHLKGHILEETSLIGLYQKAN